MGEDDDDEQRCRELEEEMDMMDGIERERGLEETLERLGFGTCGSADRMSCTS